MAVWPEIGLTHGGSGGHAGGEAVTDLPVVVEDRLLSVVGQEFCEFTDRGSKNPRFAEAHKNSGVYAEETRSGKLPDIARALKHGNRAEA
jgi:hypothetical protein